MDSASEVQLMNEAPKEQTPQDLTDRPTLLGGGISKKDTVRLSRRSEEALNSLEGINFRLRQIGLFASLFTFSNLLLIFASLSLSSIGYFNTLRRVGLIMIAITTVALALVTVHEYMRKMGDTLFEEINDDLQRGIRVSIQSSSIHSKTVKSRAAKRPSKQPVRKNFPVEAKYVLKGFARAADLPLIPGKFGPGVYALINIALLLASFLLPRPMY